MTAHVPAAWIPYDNTTIVVELPARDYLLTYEHHDSAHRWLTITGPDGVAETIELYPSSSERRRALLTGPYTFDFSGSGRMIIAGPELADGPTPAPVVLEAGWTRAAFLLFDPSPDTCLVIEAPGGVSMSANALHERSYVYHEEAFSEASLRFNTTWSSVVVEVVATKPGELFVQRGGEACEVPPTNVPGVSAVVALFAVAGALVAPCKGRGSRTAGE